MFSISNSPEFKFCIEIIQKVYTFYPHLPKSFIVFQSILKGFLFLHKYTPNYDIHIPNNILVECKQLLPKFDQDCYPYLLHLFYSYKQSPQLLEHTEYPLGTPIDYDFKSDEQNKITHILFTLLSSIAIVKESTLFTTQDMLFLHSILTPKLDLQSSITFIPTVDTHLKGLYTECNYFLYPEAHTIILKCWHYLVTQPVTLRVYLLYCIK